MKPFISCGMYVFDDASKAAWQALCSDLLETRNTVVFDCDDDTYRSRAMLLGHTCGYPLLKKWQSSHDPVCVPIFDIPGCEGANYCSWFICARENPAISLDAFRGGRAAINSRNSNSGMNVLRYAVSELIDRSTLPIRFFGQVIITGGHAASLQAVAEGEADIAAIDAVSFHHLQRTQPAMCDRTRIIGPSISLPGLPFISHRPDSDEFPHDQHSRSLPDALNRRLGNLDPVHADLLRITRFDPIRLRDYRSIERIEEIAIRRGLPALE